MSLTASAWNRPGPHHRGLRVADGPDWAGFDIRPYVDGVAAYLAGNANVLMQLARPEVAYGVLESTVDSGKVTLHPIKRQRTTLTYLAVATMGTDDDRTRYRAAVNGAHRQVRSTAKSPVKYNAFDAELQLWVAACLYRGFEDAHRALRGPLPAEAVDAFYQHGAVLATTLQVSRDMWPADRSAFEAYWQAGLAKIRYDPPVRDYLMGLVELTYLPAPVRLALRRFTRVSTGGFLHPEFRAAIGYAWTARDQREFDLMIKAIAVVVRWLPAPLRLFPFNALLWDMRRRARAGRPLV